jgi:23S rRNA (guanosine2251-2'-O)-methyltransferase
MKTKKDKNNGELIYGIHPVIEALRAKKRKVISIYTTKPTPKQWKSIEELLPKGVAIQYITRDGLTKMVDSTDHQGVVAWVQSFPIRTQFFDPKKHPILVMLDGIQDTRNVGAIIRSAYCAGADGVIVCKRLGAPLSASALKSSAGLAEHMDIFVAPTAQEAAQLLTKAGYTMYLAVFNGKNALTQEYTTPLCLVIGGEEIGVSKSILSSGIPITLPQRSKGISYNASVAAGILLCTVGVQLKKI